MNNIRKCPHCNKCFIYVGSDICPHCNKDIKDTKGLLPDFIRDMFGSKV